MFEMRGSRLLGQASGERRVVGIAGFRIVLIELVVWLAY
jgi:hypothetical protein